MLVLCCSSKYCPDQAPTVSELTNANETSHLLVKDLETAAVLFGLTRVAEATRAVQDLGERIEVNCWRRQPLRLPVCSLCRLTVSANALFEVVDLSEGGVLTAGAEEVAQRVDLNTAVAALVEEGECLLVVCCVGLIRHDS